jgi:hypothetical protein
MNEQANSYLAGLLAEVRVMLERRLSGGEGIVPPPIEAPDGQAPIDRISEVFGLSTFERRLLLLCVGVEMDPAIASLCASLHGDPHMSYVTFGLAIGALPEAHWSALAPSSALRRWHLLEVAAGAKLTSSALRIDERVLHHIAGVPDIDERLHGLIEPIPQPSELPASQQGSALQIAEVWAGAGSASTCPVVHLCGADLAGKRAVAAAACAVFGLQLYAIRAPDLPAGNSQRELLARLWEREMLLSSSALLIEDEDSATPDAAPIVSSFIQTTRGLLAVCGREPIRSHKRPIVRVEVNRPTPSEQKAVWTRALGPAASRLNGHVDLLTSQFDLGVNAMKAASEEALRKCEGDDSGDLTLLLWDACRAHSRSRLDELAQRIEPAAVWEDLVLPSPQLDVLRSIASHVRRRSVVYERWGFARKGVRGLGISSLFSGPSGTGKTMAAEVLANELRLDLYRIDLSTMVSKYIGETEKNLKRVFDAADEGGAILLFDEADALFGKRSEVKDSHDRYANIEVSYLLQRVEAYRGLAILTSNMKNALDPAFMRRIRFVTHFPFPDKSQRAQIWRRIFPPATPTEGLSVEKLSRLNLSGGNIRNLALNAAFLAADASEPVQMKHLLIAAQGEYAKLEKPLTEAEVGRWL